MPLGGHDTLPDKGFIELLGGADGALKHIGLALLARMARNHRQAMVEPFEKAILDQRLPIGIPPDQARALRACFTLSSVLIQSMQIQPLRQRRLRIER